MSLNINGIKKISSPKKTNKVNSNYAKYLGNNSTKQSKQIKVNRSNKRSNSRSKKKLLLKILMILKEK